MDTFFEQIVPIKKDFKRMAAFIGIWLLAILISIFLLIFPILGSFGLLIAFGILFGAYWLSSKLNIEYEYIITNESFDIDKIVNKSNRKRILSLDLPKISRIEKYNPSLLNSAGKSDVFFACDPNAQGSYLLVCGRSSHGGESAAYLVFTPDSRIKSAIIKFAPKYIANSAFKDQ